MNLPLVRLYGVLIFSLAAFPAGALAERLPLYWGPCDPQKPETVVKWLEVVKDVDSPTLLAYNQNLLGNTLVKHTEHSWALTDQERDFILAKPAFLEDHMRVICEVFTGKENSYAQAQAQWFQAAMAALNQLQKDLKDGKTGQVHQAGELQSLIEAVEKKVSENKGNAALAPDWWAAKDYRSQTQSWLHKHDKWLQAQSEDLKSAKMWWLNDELSKLCDVSYVVTVDRMKPLAPTKDVEGEDSELYRVFLSLRELAANPEGPEAKRLKRLKASKEGKPEAPKIDEEKIKKTMLDEFK